jgi:MFS family permease
MGPSSPLGARDEVKNGPQAVRILIGLFHGVAFPSKHAAWSVWAPPLERSKLVSAHMSGAPAGALIFVLTGFVLKNLIQQTLFSLCSVVKK